MFLKPRSSGMSSRSSTSVGRRGSEVRALELGALILTCLSACTASSELRSVDAGAGVDAAICRPVPPGTCPVVPPTAMICPDTRASSCAASSTADQICFTSATPDGKCAPPVCIPRGACQTASDCQGILPHDCQSCPLAPDGTGGEGCAHWVCNAGQCDVGYCDWGAVCVPAVADCPSFYFRFDRSCSTNADCVLATHHGIEHCCADWIYGISSRAQAHFQALESQCVRALCACQGGSVVEDGPLRPLNEEFVVPVCVSGSCRAVVRARVLDASAD